MEDGEGSFCQCRDQSPNYFRPFLCRVCFRPLKSNTPLPLRSSSQEPIKEEATPPKKTKRSPSTPSALLIPELGSLAAARRSFITCENLYVDSLELQPENPPPRTIPLLSPPRTPSSSLHSTPQPLSTYVGFDISPVASPKKNESDPRTSTEVVYPPSLLLKLKEQEKEEEEEEVSLFSNTEAFHRKYPFVKLMICSNQTSTTSRDLILDSLFAANQDDLMESEIWKMKAPGKTLPFPQRNFFANWWSFTDPEVWRCCLTNFAICLFIFEVESESSLLNELHQWMLGFDQRYEDVRVIFICYYPKGWHEKRRKIVQQKVKDELSKYDSLSPNQTVIELTSRKLKKGDVHPSLFLNVIPSTLPFEISRSCFRDQPPSNLQTVYEKISLWSQIGPQTLPYEEVEKNLRDFEFFETIGLILLAKNATKKWCHIFFNQEKIEEGYSFLDQFQSGSFVFEQFPAKLEEKERLLNLFEDKHVVVQNNSQFLIPRYFKKVEAVENISPPNALWHSSHVFTLNEHALSHKIPNSIRLRLFADFASKHRFEEVWYMGCYWKERNIFIKIWLHDSGFSEFAIFLDVFTLSLFSDSLSLSATQHVHRTLLGLKKSIIHRFLEKGLEGSWKGRKIDTRFSDHPDVPQVLWEDLLLKGKGKILGEGGQGTVTEDYFLAGHNTTPTVAVKLAKEADDVTLSEYSNEASILTYMFQIWPHPNIVHMHGTLEGGSQPGLVMELLAGGSLDKLIYDPFGLLSKLNKLGSLFEQLYTKELGDRERKKKNVGGYEREERGIGDDLFLIRGEEREISDLVSEILALCRHDQKGELKELVERLMTNYSQIRQLRKLDFERSDAIEKLKQEKNEWDPLYSELGWKGPTLLENCREMMIDDLERQKSALKKKIAELFENCTNCERQIEAQKFSPFPIELVVRVALDVASGLHFLSSLSLPIIHRDIKPENIFLTISLSQMHPMAMITAARRTVIAKIGDFGKAICMGSGINQVKVPSSLPPSYTAPEMMEQKYYSPKVDVYSFALLLFQLIFRHSPWESVESSGDLKDPWLNQERIAIAERPQIPPFSENLFWHPELTDFSCDNKLLIERQESFSSQSSNPQISFQQQFSSPQKTSQESLVTQPPTTHSAEHIFNILSAIIQGGWKVNPHERPKINVVLQHLVDISKDLSIDIDTEIHSDKSEKWPLYRKYFFPEIEPISALTIKDGFIWLGMFDGSLRLLEPNKPPKTSHPFFQRSEKVDAVICDNENQVWITQDWNVSVWVLAEKQNIPKMKKRLPKNPFLRVDGDKLKISSQKKTRSISFKDITALESVGKGSDFEEQHEKQILKITYTTSQRSATGFRKYSVSETGEFSLGDDTETWRSYLEFRIRILNEDMVVCLSILDEPRGKVLSLAAINGFVWGNLKEGIWKWKFSQAKSEIQSIQFFPFSDMKKELILFDRRLAVVQLTEGSIHPIDEKRERERKLRFTDIPLSFDKLKEKKERKVTCVVGRKSECWVGCNDGCVFVFSETHCEEVVDLKKEVEEFDEEKREGVVVGHSQDLEILDHPWEIISMCSVESEVLCAIRSGKIILISGITKKVLDIREVPNLESSEVEIGELINETEANIPVVYRKGQCYLISSELSVQFQKKILRVDQRSIKSKREEAI